MKYPLFIVTGYSGSGKTTSAPLLGKLMPEFNVFDMDIIVNNQDFQTACNNWIRIAYSNAMCGRWTVLFGSVPNPFNISLSPKIEFFNPIHLLVLSCRDDIRYQRLIARGGWTVEGINHTNDAARLMYAQATNNHICVIDTSDISPTQVVDYVRGWILEKL